MQNKVHQTILRGYVIKHYLQQKNSIIPNYGLRIPNLSFSSNNNLQESNKGSQSFDGKKLQTTKHTTKTTTKKIYSNNTSSQTSSSGTSYKREINKNMTIEHQQHISINEDGNKKIKDFTFQQQLNQNLQDGDNSGKFTQQRKTKIIQSLTDNDNVDSYTTESDSSKEFAINNIEKKLPPLQNDANQNMTEDKTSSSLKFTKSTFSSNQNTPKSSDSSKTSFSSSSSSSPLSSSPSSSQSSPSSPSSSSPSINQIIPPVPNDLSNIDIYLIGNPTSEEINRRKNFIISPHALVLHDTSPRLLSYKKGKLDANDDINKTWYQKIISSSFWSSTTTKFKRYIGNDKIEKIEKITTNVSSKVEELRTVYDTTQHPYLVKIRSIMDRMQLQTEHSKALEILQNDFKNLWLEDFLPIFTSQILPVVVRAYLSDDIEYLSKICVGEAYVFCKNMIEHRVTSNRLLSPDILWINDAELIEVKLDGKTPQVIVRGEVQTIDCEYRRDNHQVAEGSPSYIASNYFVLTLIPNLDNEYMNKIGHPWQIRRFETAKIKQLV